jgi:diguanylate cyclase (GGDEF)-like protein/PAS domain S-box-containing protein
MFSLKTMNSNVQMFSKQSESITKLKMLDKDFNYFITQKGIFVNYDNINSKIESFDIVLNSLKKSIHDSIAMNNLCKKIDHIKEDFLIKVTLLEHTKSYNSIIANSLNYLLDLKKSVKKELNLTSNQMLLIEKTLFETMGYYTNIYNNKDRILKNLKLIENISLNQNSRYLEFFLKHEREILDRISTIQQEYKNVQDLNIFKKLTVINNQLQKHHNYYIGVGRAIMMGLVLFAIIFVFSILFLHRKSLKNKKELASYKYAIENSDNSIVITDVDSNIIYVNEVFERESGYSKEEAIGKNPRILQSGMMNENNYKNIYTDLKKNKKWEGEFINKRKDGSVFYEKASILPIIIDNEVVSYLAIKLNITKYVEQERKVEFLAYHDTLTTLPNRFHFEEYFNNKILHSGKKVALFYMDLDRFKTINDSLGHSVGDKLLKVFASRLKHVLSKDDFIARIGGDEFIAIVNHGRKMQLSLVGQRILDSFKDPIVIEGHSLNISTSIGISLYPLDGRDLGTLMKHADTAMYKAKLEGRNNFRFFTKKLSDEINYRLTIEQELQNALKKNELYVVYQPKYNLNSKKIIGFEALIRWENEKLGFVEPDKFILVSEEIGLINEIGYFVYEKACKDFLTLKEIDPSLDHISINISTVQFNQNDFIQNLNKISKSIAIEPTSVELEVTETYIMEDVDKNIMALQELKDLGYKIAIDDFGTGYSSFSYLNKLPINTLKIDKSFVDNICSVKKERDIANSIIALANNLNFNIVVEGIEYKDQEELLINMGCTIGQGYLFSRPQKLKDLKLFVKNSAKELVSV